MRRRVETERSGFGIRVRVSEPLQPIARFLPDPVRPGPFGVRFSVFDHRGVRRNLAKASWADRFRHSPEVARRIPVLTVKASSVGVGIIVIVCTFMIQDFTQRAMAGARTVKPGEIHFVTQAIGLFAPVFFTMFFAGASIFAIATRVWIPGVARQWLAMGSCASCRYSLAEIEPEADGCVVCPECGGAWKISRTNSEPPTSVGAVGREVHKRA